MWIALLFSILCLTVADNSVHQNAVDQELCQYDFRSGSFQPALDIFVVDRSTSVNIKEFHEAREFIKQLIHKRFRINEDYNRISIVTFAKDFTVDLDLITSDSVPPECELFQPQGGWQNIQYDCENSNMNQQSLYGALNKSLNIFANAKRHYEHKRLWLFTDFHDFNDVTLDNYLSSVDLQDIVRYGVGTNLMARNETQKQHIKKRFCKFTTEQSSSDCECQYKQLHTDSDNWQHVLNTFADLKTDVNNSKLVNVTSNLVCVAHNDTCVNGCQCREFLITPSSIHCNVSEVYSDSVFTILLAVLCVFFLMSVSLLTTLVILRCRRGPSHKSTLPVINQNVSTSTQDLSYDIEGYLTPIEWFQPTLRQVTVTRRNSDSSVCVKSDTTVDLQYNNSLYQLPDISGQTPYRKQLYQKGPSAHCINQKKTQGQPRPYENTKDQSDTTKPSNLPYLEILPSSKTNYEPVTFRLKVPPSSSHSYQSVKFPSVPLQVAGQAGGLAATDDDCESGYASRCGSVENLKSSSKIKRDASKKESVRHLGIMKFKHVASLFEK